MIPKDKKNKIEKCDVCDKKLGILKEDGGSLNIKGMSIIVRLENIKDTKEHECLQEQLGDYKIGKEYNVCWECWFKSLGVKP